MEQMEQRVYTVEGEETEIDLISLFASLLRSWKVILIWGIVCCLLGAAFQAYRMRQDDEAYEKSFAEYNRQLANYNDAVDAYQREKDAVQDDIDDVYSYIDKSILLKINPYREAYASADLLFDVENDDFSLVLDDKLSLKNSTANRVLGVYAAFLDNGISYDIIGKQYDLEDRFIRELVSYQTVPENGDLRVFVRHTDLDAAGAILDYVLERIEEQKDSFAQDMPEHSYSVVNKAVREKVDDTLITAVDELRSGTTIVKNVNTQYSKQLDKIDEYNKRIEAINEKLAGLTPPMSIEANTQRGILKFALIGLLGGLVLGAILRTLRLFLGGKLLDRQPLMLRFGLRLLAAFPHGKKGVFNRLADRLLVAETGLREDEVYAVAVNSVHWVTGEKKSNILIAAGHEIKEHVCRGLQEGLSAKDPANTYVLVSSFGNNLHTQQALEDCDYVVLLAEIGRTRQETITNILNISEQYGKPAMGVILYN